MDVFKIVSSDAYKFDNLTEENQNHIKWLSFLVEDLAERKLEYEDSKNDGLIQKLYNEIAREVVDDLVGYARIQLAEYQITMIENQDEDESDV